MDPIDQSLVRRTRSGKVYTAQFVSSILKPSPFLYKYASDMDVPLLQQLQSNKAFQEARNLHDSLLSNYYDGTLRDPLTPILAPKNTSCFDQSFHPTVPHKSVRFKEELEIRFQIFGKENDTFFERLQPMQERNNSLTFSTHLMVNVLGLDVSPREFFYDVYWSKPTRTNDRLEHLTK